MTQPKPIVKTHIAFWVKPYINFFKLLCLIHGVEYQFSMISKTVGKGIHWERVQ
ncbi:hypothetical protein [Shewanella surugensis]|uniref:Uncharacterized protein n=1 Tax=Shewanella surugensis TaxID=212020 RepID=A0ABT0L8U3_9GAMM|nr:hypothetical protein [Shewanella surugensis]MCL1124117.1 hypothetical protein [Shewanella surugensis]